MDKCILYGAGKMGINALHFIGHSNVICFCDNSKNEEEIEGIKVYSFADITKSYNNELIVITPISPKSLYEITKQLAELKYNYTLLDYYVEDVIRQEADKYNRLNKRKTFEYRCDNEYLFARDKMNSAGHIDSYFWQDLWAAKKIYKNKPKTHYDIGSRVDGFIGHLLSFGQKVTQIDIRPLNSMVEGLNFVQQDATSLQGIPDSSIESLSALCSLEHFGLGRYGDPIDPEACFKCFSAIQKKMKSGGLCYISVPIGMEHLEFNAHRIFSPKTIIDCFDQMNIIEFSTANIDEYTLNDSIDKYNDVRNRSGNLFGLFELKKK